MKHLYDVIAIEIKDGFWSLSTVKSDLLSLNRLIIVILLLLLILFELYSMATCINSSETYIFGGIHGTGNGILIDVPFENNRLKTYSVEVSRSVTGTSSVDGCSFFI